MNALATTIDCPYCLARIPAGASMCQHCGQHVGPLLETRARLAEAEKKLGEVTAQVRQLTGQDPVEPVVLERWSPALALAVFYVASIAATVGNIAEGYDVQLLVVMAALLGVVIASRDDGPNVWSIAMFAFAQPLLASVVVVLQTDKAYLVAHKGEMVVDAAVLAAELAAAAAIAASLYMLFFRRTALKSAARLPTLEGATGRMERILKLGSVVGTAVTMIAAALTYLVNLVSKTG